MRRKGGRTIATAAAAAPLSAANGMPPPPPSATATANANTSSPAFPAVTIPTLDIFARFQGKRDDFEANWLMLEEDVVDADKAPPISNAVAEKLRRHQRLLSETRTRAGARKDATSTTTTAATSSSSTTNAAMAVVGGSGASSSTGTTPSMTTGRGGNITSRSSVKGGADFDRVSTEVTVPAATPAGAVGGGGGDGKRKTRRGPPALQESEEDEEEEHNVDGQGSNEEGGDADDDEPYVPESGDAAQYQNKTKNSKKQKRSPAKVDAAAAAATTTTAEEKAVEEEEEEEEGMQGDYLNFLPKNMAATAANPNADANDLQAVVSIAKIGGQPTSRKLNDAIRKHEESSPTQSQPSSPTQKDQQQLVVPLWSVERVRRFGGYYSLSRLVALHEEVTDLIDFLRPTQAEISIRRHVELEVTRLTKKLWPGSRVIVYGSLYTQLLLPLSDVDMTLVGLPSSVTPEDALTALANEVSRAGLCEAAYPQLILKTKVPLIKFQHKGSLVDIDISVNAPDGKSNSDIVIHLINFYPEARPLILAVKYFLQQRDMHEPYHGGLGSYATTLLVISFLQSHPIYTSRPQERPFTGLGKLLVDFFRYCGQYWRYSNCALSLTDGGRSYQRVCERDDYYSPTSPTSPRSPLGPPQAVIEDPLNAANNAASSLRNYHMIASVFTSAYQALTAPFPTAFEFNASSSSTGGSGAPSRRGVLSSEEEGVGAAPSPAKTLGDFTPDAQQIALRPTLLSRVFHIDADTVYRRQSIAATYAQLCETNPETMASVEAYKAAEDGIMLRGTHELRVVVPTIDDSRPNSPVTRAEAKGIASLAAASTKRARRAADASSPSSSSYASSSEEEEEVGSRQFKKTRREFSAKGKSKLMATRSGSAKDEESGGDDDDDDASNASSVRLDVSKPTKRRKQLSRQR